MSDNIHSRPLVFIFFLSFVMMISCQSNIKNDTIEDFQYADFTSDSSEVTNRSDREWNELLKETVPEDTFKAENCNLIYADSLFPDFQLLFGNRITSKVAFDWMRESEKKFFRKIN